MKNLKWLWLAVGMITVGTVAYSLAPDLYRYMRIRSM